MLAYCSVNCTFNRPNPEDFGRNPRTADNRRSARQVFDELPDRTLPGNDLVAICIPRTRLGSDSAIPGTPRSRSASSRHILGNHPARDQVCPSKPDRDHSFPDIFSATTCFARAFPTSDLVCSITPATTPSNPTNPAQIRPG